MPPLLPSTAVTTVPEGTFGPYFARQNDRALLLYAAPAPSGGRSFYASVIDDSGRPIGPPALVSAAPETSPKVVVRAAGKGFVAVWGSTEGGTTSIVAALFDAAGALAGAARTIVQRPGELVSVDLIALDTGMVVVWAEKRTRAAALFTVALAADMTPKSPPLLVVEQARAWQTAAAGGRVALAYVGATAKEAGQVMLALLDERGRPVGDPKSVSGGSGGAEPDVDMVRMGDRLLLAWSDKRAGDAHVFMTAVDLAGTVAVPARDLTTHRGEQALVGLVAPALPTTERQRGRALLAYDELDAGGGEKKRTIRLGLVDENLGLAKETASLTAAASPRENIEFAAAPDGFVATMFAPMCVSDPCEGAAPWVPSAARFGPGLSVLASEPLRPSVLAGATPAMALDPWCGRAGCFALAAGTAQPGSVSIVAVQLPAKESRWAASAARDSPRNPPAAVALDALWSGERIADVAATGSKNGTLLAWVTYFVEGAPHASPTPPGARAKPVARIDPGDPKKPREAILNVLALDPDGAPAGSPTVLSMRAASVGGVAVASAEGDSGDACVAWVARDAGDLQVFVTKVNAKGARLTQRMLTQAKGDASDVAIATVKNGWAVAWVDARRGHGEVYVTKIDQNLRTLVAEHPVLEEHPGTHAPASAPATLESEASDVTLLARDDDLLVAWASRHRSDSAGARATEKSATPSTPQDFRTDLVVLRLPNQDLRATGRETVAWTSPRALRSPTLGARGAEVVLAASEDAVEEGDAAGASAAGEKRARTLLIALGNTGTSPAPPQILTTDGLPLALAMSCDNAVCWLTLASTNADALAWDAYPWRGMQSGNAAPTTSPARLLTTRARGRAISAALVGHALIFGEDDAKGRGVLRLMRIAWN